MVKKGRKVGFGEDKSKRICKSKFPSLRDKHQYREMEFGFDNAGNSLITREDNNFSQAYSHKIPSEERN